MADIYERIERCGILPELTLYDAIDAIAVGQAINEGGIPIAEVTFRTPAAKQSIQLMSSAIPDMMVGAGTVLTTEQVDEAIEAGASFIVSPGISPTVVNYCKERDIPVIPGVSSPTDIETALTLGLSIVKFFPAEANGGIDAIHGISEPYPELRFVASGGINDDNLEPYLHSQKVLAVSGNWLVSRELIENRDFEEITRRCHTSINRLLGLEFDHVGFNYPKAEEAKMAAEDISRMFGTSIRDKDGGYYAGGFFQAVRPGGSGTIGHFAFRTNHIGRAMSYMQLRGVEFDDNTAVYNEAGDLISIYVKGEVHGTAIQIKQREEQS